MSSQDSGSTSELEKAIVHLEGKGVRFIRLTWVDLLNFVRFRIITISHFKKLCVGSAGKKPARGMSATVSVLALAFLTPPLDPSFIGETDEHLYIPDFSTVRLLSYAKDQASMLGWWEYKYEDKGRVPLCPRDLLRRIVEKAKETYNVSFLVGFETEVIFLKSIDLSKAANDYLYCESPAICAGTPESLALEEIAEALEKANIELQMYHSEGAPGQYEFVTGPLQPLEAADALICTRETIVNIASKHGFRATFAPRVYPQWPGSSAHVHMSLRSSLPTSSRSANIDSAPGLSQLEASFLQGLLSHLPAVCAFSLPLAASYARVKDGIWSGGTYVSWGRDNRETPIRLCGTESDYHFEVRCNDGTANPYLSLASMVSAGMLDVKANATLSIANSRIMPAKLSDAERQKLGVRVRLPSTVEQARQNLQDDNQLVAELGEEFVRVYLSAHEALKPQMERATPEETLKQLTKNF